MGLHNSLDVRNYLTSNIDDSVNSIDAHRSYDASGMGPGNDFSEDMDGKINREEVVIEETQQIPNNPEISIVRHLCCDYFRERLVEHFNILFERNEIVWPTRNKRN